MKTRLPIAIVLILIIGALTSWAYQSAQLYVLRAGLAGSLKYDLLFNSAVLALPVAALIGVFLGAFDNKDDSETKIVNGKIERHSELMFIQHWSHAIGTVILIITGIGLGTLFIPRTFQGVEKVGFALNMHFIGILLFFFGASFYVTKGLLSGEISHMMPKKGDIMGAIGHYKAMIFGGDAPKEEKFLAVERVIFPFWIFGVSGIVITGIIKTIAHIWSIPGGVMGLITLFHGLFAIYMALLLCGHVFAAAILPASWPLIRSMITGTMDEKYVAHHHAKWYEEIQAEKGKKTFEASTQDADLEVASTQTDQ